MAFQAASALEKRVIQAKHIASGNVKEFKNRTEFWGKGKTIGGWLGALNEVNEKKGKKTFTKEDFEVIDVQIPAEDISHTFQAAKQRATSIAAYLQCQKYCGVIGVGKTFRHSFLLPKEYKSERSAIRPIQLNETKDFLVEFHNGDVVTGIEADDKLEIIGTKGWNNYKETGKFSHIVASIDKDSLSTPSLFFNFHKQDGNWLHPEIILIDDSVGDLWLVEKKDSKGKITRECKGWGSKWLAYQMLCGDSTDSIRPYQDFGHKFGDVTCHTLLENCATQAELFKTVKNQFYTWFPSGVQFTAWNGEDVSMTTDEWIETIFQLVYMKRVEKDTTTFESMLNDYINKEESK